LTGSRPLSSLSELEAPEDVRTWIAARIPGPARLTDLNLYCTSDLPDRILCLIDLADANAGQVADALSGQAFGFTSAVVTLPIGASFSCRCRQPGVELATQSCCCNPVGQSRPSWLDRD
jgi:hypothetical protein